jgi:hypothetical protein
MKSHNHTRRTTKNPRGHQKRAPNAHYKTLGHSIMARDKRPHKFSFIGSALTKGERELGCYHRKKKEVSIWSHILRGGIFTRGCCCYCEVENCE